MGASLRTNSGQCGARSMSHHTSPRPPRGRVHSRSRCAFTVAVYNLMTPAPQADRPSQELCSWVRRTPRRGRRAAADSIRECGSTLPSRGRQSPCRSAMPMARLAQRGYNNGSTPLPIAGPEDDQSDDRADACEQVAEADENAHMRTSLGRGRLWRGRRDTTVGCENGPASQTHLSRLNQDVAAGDFEAAYSESFRRRLRRGWRLITGQFPHQGKDKVGVRAVVVLS
jgi:hypothetical protein